MFFARRAKLKQVYIFQKCHIFYQLHSLCKQECLFSVGNEILVYHLIPCTTKNRGGKDPLYKIVTFAHPCKVCNHREPLGRIMQTMNNPLQHLQHVDFY